MRSSKLPRRIRSACGVALLLVISDGTALAQIQPAPVAAVSSDVAAGPAFEVATIKRNTSGSGGSSSNFGGGDRFIATNVTIKNLLQYSAFHISGLRIVGGPKWLDSAHFDIDAKLDPAEAQRLGALPRSERTLQFQALFQGLLADRFQFKTHWEEREQPVYALSISKSGSKLKTAADTQHGSGSSSGNGRIQGTNVTLTQVAEILTQEASDELGRVVVDQTGIPGTFDFNLKWIPEIGAASADASSAAVSGPSLFTAIQEQLGLKLEPAKAPVRVLVIDRLEMPSEN
jgi:uncharacterized protein (TIGR03435 family)